jgi:hypothetical protein
MKFGLGLLSLTVLALALMPLVFCLKGDPKTPDVVPAEAPKGLNSSEIPKSRSVDVPIAYATNAKPKKLVSTFQVVKLDNGVPTLLQEHTKLAAAKEHLESFGLDGIAIVRLDRFVLNGQPYSIPQVVFRNISTEVEAAWKTMRGEQSTKPPDVDRLRKSHIGSNYQRWCAKDAVQTYTGLSRFLLEAYSIPDETWPKGDADYRWQEIGNAATWGGGYLCISHKPARLNWSGHDNCGWWNAGTTGTRVEDYSDMMAVVKESLTRLKGKVKYFEGENERNRHWMPTGDNKYTVEQEAACQRAIWLTVQDVDPTIQVVFAGLSYFDDDRLSACKALWAKDGTMPFHIISAHHYCFTGNGPKTVNNSLPRSPDADGFKKRCEVFVKATRALFGDSVPIWLGEFGYASNESNSIVHAQNLDVTPDLAAEYTMLMARYAIEAGFARVQFYMLQDLGDYNLYGRCGHYHSVEEPGKPRVVKRLGKEFQSLYNLLRA